MKRAEGWSCRSSTLLAFLDITEQAVAAPAMPAATMATLDRAALRALAERLTPANAAETRTRLLSLLAVA